MLQVEHHATVIPSRITPFSSDHGRQTGLGQISTTLGDHAGISGAVAFCIRPELTPEMMELIEFPKPQILRDLDPSQVSPCIAQAWLANKSPLALVHTTTCGNSRYLMLGGRHAPTLYLWHSVGVRQCRPDSHHQVHNPSNLSALS